MFAVFVPQLIAYGLKKKPNTYIRVKHRQLEVGNYSFELKTLVNNFGFK